MVSGVKAVSADLDSKRVTVTVDAAPTLSAVESTLAEIGYPGTK
jgi:copper chaperone CopZ